MSKKEWSEFGSSLKAGKVFSEIKAIIESEEGKEIATKLQASFKYIVNDPKTKDKKAVWILDLKDAAKPTIVEITDGTEGPAADSTFTMTDDNFINIAVGKVNPQAAYRKGQLKLKGNLPKAMAFNTQVFQKKADRIKEVLAKAGLLDTKAKL